MIEINKSPSRGELRWFGLIAAAFFGFIGGVLLAASGGESLALSQGLWAFGALLALVYYAIPAIQRAVYIGWMYAVFPIGWVVSHLLLGVTFYLVLTPIGLLLRLAGKDLLQRRLDRNAPSYWMQRKGVPEAPRYFKQF